MRFFNTKIAKKFLPAIIAASVSVILILGAPIFSAQAVNGKYAIIIDDFGANKNQEIIFDYSNLGQGDTLSGNISVENKNNRLYSVSLKKIEIIKDSILLDKVTFSYKNLIGGNSFSFSKSDFGKTDWPMLYVATPLSNGNFALSAEIGKLTNEYQNQTATVRFTFEIVDLFPDRQTGSSPNTGDDFVGYLALFACAMIFAILAFMLILLAKRRKREKKAQ